MPLNIYSTVSENYLYIGTEKGFIGKVKVDTSATSRFFNKLFGDSMDVTFGDKVKTVNKKSYFKLLQQLNGDKVNPLDIHKYTSFTDVVDLDTAKVLSDMRYAISKADSLNLFKKLGDALSGHRTEEALKYLYKGAAIDYPLYDRDIFGISLTGPTEGLPSNEPYETTVFKGTPLLYAAYKANTVAKNALFELTKTPRMLKASATS